MNHLPAPRARVTRPSAIAGARSFLKRTGLALLLLLGPTAA